MKSIFTTLVFLYFFLGAQAQNFYDSLAYFGASQVYDTVVYDGSYYRIPYPGGDVPKGIGVCTDVVIRAYRKLGIDLQKLIHEDMKVALSDYNKKRKTTALDASIDHRRTQNQETYFERQGGKLDITNNASDYKPGDLVFWDVAYGHVGIVTSILVPGTNRYYIVHNIGRGNQIEDFLFGATIVGHYRWKPQNR